MPKNSILFYVFIQLYLVSVAVYAQSSQLSVQLKNNATEVISTKSYPFDSLENKLTIYQQQNDYRNTSACHKELGNLYYESGNYTKSVEHYQKGLQLAETNNLTNLIPLFINNIGLVYLKQEHYDKALEHFQRSAFISKKGYHYAIAINNVGVVKHEQGNYAEALDYYKLSVNACPADDVACIVTALNGIANTHLQQKELDKALNTMSYIVGLQKGKEQQEQDLLVSYNRIGLIYKEKEQYETAIDYFHKSLEIAKRYNSLHRPYIHANLSDTYLFDRRHEEALEHMAIFHRLKDSVNAIAFKLQTEELLTQYETKKKEQQITFLQKEQQFKDIELQNKEALLTEEVLKNTLKQQENKYKMLQQDREIDLLTKDKELQSANLLHKQQELQRQTQLRKIILISAILIIIPVLILLFVYRQKVKNKELLAIKTEEVNRQQSLEMMRSFEMKNIRSYIEGQEKERHRIAKELHDGVAGSLAAIKMRMQSQHNSLPENLSTQKLIESVDNVYREVRTISHHLTPPGILKDSFIPFIRKYLNDIASSADFEIEFIAHGENEINQLADEIKVEIYRILQELISNIIKHAHADLVEVQLIKDDNDLNMIVEDRGMGFDIKSKKSGLGLSNLSSRVQTLGGTIAIDSVLGRGTIVNIDIKLNANKA